MENLKKQLNAWISEHYCYAEAYTPAYMVYHTMIDIRNQLNENNWEMAQVVFEKLKNIY